MHLSNEEDLAYRRLLEMYYDTEQPIPDDLQLVSRRIRVTPEALLFVLQEFFVLVNKGWKNKRCDLVINDYHEMAEKNRRNGKKGGRPKKPKDEQENPLGFQSVPSGMPVVTQVKANQEPITINHKPKRESATSVACPPDVGEQVWQDWLSLRKTKKAAVTPTVIDGARKEAEKLGWPLEKFLVEWCTRGSQGLKAEWVAPKPTFAQQAADVARTTVPAQHSGPDPVLLQIAADRQKAAPMPDHIRQQINQVLRKA